MGNDIGLGPARSVVYVRWMDLDNNSSTVRSRFKKDFGSGQKVS